MCTSVEGLAHKLSADSNGIPFHPVAQVNELPHVSTLNMGAPDVVEPRKTWSFAEVRPKRGRLRPRWAQRIPMVSARISVGMWRICNPHESRPLPPSKQGSTLGCKGPCVLVSLAQEVAKRRRQASGSQPGRKRPKGMCQPL